MSLDVGRFKFGNRVCNEWNMLSEDVVSAGSLNTFKAKLDHHLRIVRGLFKHFAFSPYCHPGATLAERMANGKR